MESLIEKLHNFPDFSSIQCVQLFLSVVDAKFVPVAVPLIK